MIARIPISSYHSIVGDSPECGPGDHRTARRHLERINRAIEHGGWTETERSRLYRLQAKWALRANGEDPRFEIVGTQNGRLSKGIEKDIDEQRKIIDIQRRMNRRLRDKRHRPVPIEEYDDPVLTDPDGTAQGRRTSARDDDSDDGDSGGWRQSRNPDEEYYVSASDSRGHNAPLQFRVQPRHMSALMKIQEEGKFPFESLSEVARWCVDKGIEELNRRRPSAAVGSMLQQARVINNFLREEKLMQDYEESFNAIRDTVQKYLALGATKQARRVIARTKHDIEMMPEGYWRDKFHETIVREFGHLLTDERGTEVASFVEDEGDGEGDEA